MNQEPRKTRLWSGAAYRGGEAETQAVVPARGRKPSGASLPPLGGDAESGPVSTGPIRRSFPSAFRDPPRLGRKGAYWQTSGLKKQAGSGAIDHIGAPAGTVFEGGDFALPRAVRGAPGAFPLPARPAARSLLSCTAGGGGRRFRTCSQPVEPGSLPAWVSGVANRRSREAGRPCRRPSRRPFSAGAEPFRCCVTRRHTVTSAAHGWSWGLRTRHSNSDCLGQGKRV